MEYDLEVMTKNNYLGVQIANTGVEEYRMLGRNNIIYYMLMHAKKNIWWKGGGRYFEKESKLIIDGINGDPSIISMGRTQKMK